MRIKLGWRPWRRLWQKLWICNTGLTLALCIRLFSCSSLLLEIASAASEQGTLRSITSPFGLARNQRFPKAYKSCESGDIFFASMNLQICTALKAKKVSSRLRILLWGKTPVWKLFFLNTYFVFHFMPFSSK